MCLVSMIEGSITRKLEDLTNELAYIDHYPNRGNAAGDAVRRSAVLDQIKRMRTLLINWAMPIELLQET